MDRPKWWEFDTPGKYLHAQYKYIKSIKKVNIKDFIIPIGAKNRSSIYNIFRGTLSINPDKLEIFKTVFKLTEVEVEYLALLYARDRSSYEYERNVWAKAVDDFKLERKPKSGMRGSSKTLDSKWDDFIKAESNIEGRKKKRVKIPAS